jgi:hypothetical protein
VSGRLSYRCDAAADGGWNMAADELLAEGLPDGGVHMRFYGWSEPTLSLGAFQRHADLAAAALPPGVPVVRRPSGGLDRGHLARAVEQRDRKDHDGISARRAEHGDAERTHDGVQASGSAGMANAIGGVLAIVNSPEATGSVGSVTATGAAVVSVTGLSATAEVDSVTADTATRALVDGLEATASVSDVTVNLSSVLSVTGLQASAEVGTAIGAVPITVVVTGLQATGSVGTAVIPTSGVVSVVGVSATGYVGSAMVWGQIVPNQNPLWTRIAA